MRRRYHATIYNDGSWCVEFDNLAELVRIGSGREATPAMAERYARELIAADKAKRNAAAGPRIRKTFRVAG